MKHFFFAANNKISGPLLHDAARVAPYAEGQGLEAWPEAMGAIAVPGTLNIDKGRVKGLPLASNRHRTSVNLSTGVRAHSS